MYFNGISTGTLGARTPTPGPELDLLTGALEKGLPFDPDHETTYFQEPRLPTGFPDLLAVSSRQSTVTLNPSRIQLEVCHLRLLFHIHRVGNTSIEALVDALLWKSKDLANCVDALETSELVYVRGKNIRPKALREVFAVSKIVALEAKISHWQKALEQAVANTWFASQSYILLPKGTGALKAAKIAPHFGVGVLIFDGLKTTELVKSSDLSIPSSYGSWLINEWVIRKWFTEKNQNDRFYGIAESLSRSIRYSPSTRQ